MASASTNVKISVAGKAIQTPVTPHSCANSSTKATMTTRPRLKEMARDWRGCSTAAMAWESTVFTPASFLGWLPSTTFEARFDDWDEIPAWAQDDYRDLDAYSIAVTTMEYGDTPDENGDIETTMLAEPNKPLLRSEMIEFLYHGLLFLPCYPTETAIAWGFDTDMPVIDGSTSTYPYTTTLFGTLFFNYTGHPAFPESHSKSYYSYDRLISGEADLLIISTKPTEDTLAKAKAAGVELELTPIAYDAMVFFTNSENPIGGLTMDQIRTIYVDNPYTNWQALGGPDAAFIPYCRNMDSGSQAQMEEFFLKGDEIHPDIRRETTSVSMASVLTDVANAYQEDPPAYALGYSIYYYYQAASQILLGQDDLKLLPINGVYPSDETIADGTYPLAGYNYAVVRADEPVLQCRLRFPGPADDRFPAQQRRSALRAECRLRSFVSRRMVNALP